MTFTDMDPLVTVDLETNVLFLDSPGDANRYRRALDRLDRAALNDGQSRTLIADLGDHFDGAQASDTAFITPATQDATKSLTC